MVSGRARTVPSTSQEAFLEEGALLCDAMLRNGLQRKAEEFLRQGGGSGLQLTYWLFCLTPVKSIGRFDSRDYGFM